MGKHKWQGIGEEEPTRVVCRAVETTRGEEGAEPKEVRIAIPGWLYQVGKGAVQQAAPPAAAHVRAAKVGGSTVKVAIAIHQQVAGEGTWRAAHSGKLDAVRSELRKLFEKLELDFRDAVLDVWGLELNGPMVQCVARVKASMSDSLVAASGKETCIFASPIGQQRQECEIIWLPVGWDIGKARAMVESLEGTRGLVINANGIGVRVESEAVEKARSRLGIRKGRVKWRARGFPVDVTAEEAQAVLRSAGWTAAQVSQGGRRID